MNSLYKKCSKCGSDICEMKIVVIPNKKMGELSINFDKFFMKICQDCGYTEFYSRKIIEKNEKTLPTV